MSVENVIKEETGEEEEEEEITCEQQLTEEQRDEFKEAFTLYDKDGDGFITRCEFGKVVRSLGQNVTEGQLAEMVEELMPTNEKDMINFNGFLSYFSCRLKDTDDDEELREAFRVFDKEETGLVNVAELRHCLTNMGDKLTDEECDELILEADPMIEEGFVRYEKLITKMMSV